MAAHPSSESISGGYREGGIGFTHTCGKDTVYWQFFCGEEVFRHDMPACATQLIRWRRRIGEKGVEQLLKLSIQAGLKTKTVTKKETEVVVVDTTVQPKGVEFPTDARLFRKVLRALLRVADKTGVKLRQTHRNLAKLAFLKHARYMKAA